MYLIHESPRFARMSAPSFLATHYPKCDGVAFHGRTAESHARPPNYHEQSIFYEHVRDDHQIGHQYASSWTAGAAASSDESHSTTLTKATSEMLVDEPAVLALRRHQNDSAGSRVAHAEARQPHDLLASMHAAAAMAAAVASVGHQPIVDYYNCQSKFTSKLEPCDCIPILHFSLKGWWL